MQQDVKPDQAVVEKLLLEQVDRKDEENVPFLFSKRFLVAILIFFGYFNVVVLKANLNIAIVEMTSKRSTIFGNLTILEPAEFVWDSTTVGFILSMYAYGYQTCLAGGYVVNKLGGSVTYGGSIVLMSVLNVITPICLQFNYYLFLVTRLFIGLLDGMAYTATMEMLSRWAPVHERSTILSLSFTGIYVGIAATYPICGFLTFKWGWPASFYFAGIVGIIWYAFWLPLVKNKPSNDRWISKKELSYITQHTETTPRKQIKHPYKAIFTSPQVWALNIGEFAYSWGFNLLVMCFPLYVKDMTGRTIDEVGLIASIPNVICMFMMPLAGIIMDFWQNNSTLSRTQIHKTMMGIGFLTETLCFLIVAYSSNFTLSMGCFIVIKLMISFNYLILKLVCLAMSPKHSSVLAGASAFCYTISVILIPNTVGFIVRNHSLAEWSTCFLLSAAVSFFGAVVFLIFGSSELQPWSKPSNGEMIDGCETDMVK